MSHCRRSIAFSMRMRLPTTVLLISTTKVTYRVTVGVLNALSAVRSKPFDGPMTRWPLSFHGGVMA